MQVTLIAGKFDAGFVVTTPNAAGQIPEADRFVCLIRHVNGDWGDQESKDWETNESALKSGGWRPQGRVVVDSSRQGFQIRPEDVCHPADLGSFPQLVDGCFLLSQAVTEGLEGYIDADLVTVLEAIGHGLGWRINSDTDAFEGVVFDAVGQCFTREADDPQGRRAWFREPRLPIKGQPDLKGSLRGQSVKLQGRQQAHDSARHSLRRFDERPLF